MESKHGCILHGNGNVSNAATHATSLIERWDNIKRKSQL